MSAKQQHVAFSLKFDGADEPRRFELGADESIFIGRDPKCDITIKCNSVSSRHCELRFMECERTDGSEGYSLCIRDLSMNGVGIRSRRDKEPMQLEKDELYVVSSGHTYVLPHVTKGSRAIFTVRIEETASAPLRVTKAPAPPREKAPPPPGPNAQRELAAGSASAHPKQQGMQQQRRHRHSQVKQEEPRERSAERNAKQDAELAALRQEAAADLQARKASRLARLARGIEAENAAAVAAAAQADAIAQQHQQMHHGGQLMVDIAEVDSPEDVESPRSPESDLDDLVGAAAPASVVQDWAQPVPAMPYPIPVDSAEQMFLLQQQKLAQRQAQQHQAQQERQQENENFRRLQLQYQLHQLELQMPHQQQQAQRQEVTAAKRAEIRQRLLSNLRARKQKQAEAMAAREAAFPQPTGEESDANDLVGAHARHTSGGVGSVKLTPSVPPSQLVATAQRPGIGYIPPVSATVPMPPPPARLPKQPKVVPPPPWALRPKETATAQEAASESSEGPAFDPLRAANSVPNVLGVLSRATPPSVPAGSEESAREASPAASAAPQETADGDAPQREGASHSSSMQEAMSEAHTEPSEDTKGAAPSAEVDSSTSRQLPDATTAAADDAMEASAPLASDAGEHRTTFAADLEPSNPPPAAAAPPPPRAAEPAEGKVTAKATAVPAIPPGSPDWAPLLEGIYAKYNPSKVPELDKIMAKYRGAEAVLYTALVKKYGPFDVSSLLPIAPSSEGCAADKATAQPNAGQHPGAEEAATQVDTADTAAPANPPSASALSAPDPAPAGCTVESDAMIPPVPAVAAAADGEPENPIVDAAATSAASTATMIPAVEVAPVEGVVHHSSAAAQPESAEGGVSTRCDAQLPPPDEPSPVAVTTVDAAAIVQTTLEHQNEIATGASPMDNVGQPQAVEAAELHEMEVSQPEVSQPEDAGAEKGTRAAAGGVVSSKVVFKRGRGVKRPALTTGEVGFARLRTA